MSVASSQRFSRRHPCPICGGGHDEPQGQGARCYGFLSDDGEYAHCTREEHAGNLAESPAGTFAHRLIGDCACGDRHDPRPATTPAPKRDRGRVVYETRYDARDADGTLAGVKIRREYADGSKAFTWQQPDGTPGLNGRSSVDMPLYGIDRIGRTKYGVITEGEKAQQALASIDIPAVGTMTGAKSIPSDDTLAAIVHVPTVVLWPDNDADGARHMQRIGERLVSLGAADVRVVDWHDAPAKGDAADFVATGADRGAVRDLLREARTWEAVAVPAEPEPARTRLEIVSLSDVESRDVDWLHRRWLPLGKLTLLGGHAGDGKSTLTAAIAAILSLGGTWPDGERAPQGRTLFLLAEDALDDTLKPRLVLHGADCSQVLALRAVRDADGRERGFSLAKHIDELEAAIVAYNITLLVIDPLSSFLQGADRNGEDVRDILTPLVQLLDRRHVAGIGVMHVGKPGAGAASRRGLQMFLGATAFGALARTAWALAPAPTDDDPNRRVLGVVKSNLAMRPANLAFTRDEDGPIRWLGTTTDDIEQLLTGFHAPEAKTPERADILDVLAEHPEGLSPQQIADALDKPVSNIRNLLRRMDDAGEVSRPRTGIYKSHSHKTCDSDDSCDSESQESLKSQELWQGATGDSSSGDHCRSCGAALYSAASIEHGVCARCLNGATA